MSPPWTNLPYELVQKIFSNFINKRDVLNLQHICQSWRQAAQERLYNDVQLVSDAQENQLIETLINPNNKARHFVKQISSGTYNYRFSSLPAIGSLCQNITSIQLGSPSRELYRIIYQLRQANHLQELQRIPSPTMENSIDDYCELIVLVKDSATEISLCHDPGIAIPEIGSVLGAFPITKHMKDLKAFPCLEKVFIETSAFMYPSQLDELLGMCSTNNIKKILLALPNITSRQVRRHLSTAKQQINVVPWPSVKELVWNTGALLTDQDMRFIMDKFPALQRLTMSIDRFDEKYSFIDSIQSQETVIAFIEFLYRIPCCEVDIFGTTPDIMYEIISQLSKNPQVIDLCMESTDQNEAAFTGIRVGRPGSHKQTIGKRVHLHLSPQMESLYQHALQVFSLHQIEHLELLGSVDWNITSGKEEPNSWEKLEGKALIDSLDYAINHHTGLKSISLGFAIFRSTLFNPQMVKRLQLEDLNTDVHSMDDGAWNMLSKRLESVQNFCLRVRTDIFGDYDETYTVYMPHTTIGTINLEEYMDFGNLKISTGASTTFYMGVKNEYRGEIERLTEQDYIQRKEEYDGCFCTEITCKEWSTLRYDGVIVSNDD